MRRKKKRARRAKKPARRANPALSYRDTHWGIDSEKTTTESVHEPGDNERLIGLGTLLEVVYVTRKGFDGVSEYEHKFSEKNPPLLAYGSNDRKLYIVGGSYRVTKHGIVD